MRLEKVLDVVNQIEKSSFLKIIDNLSNECRQDCKEIDIILSECDDQIKNVDSKDIVRLFRIVKKKFEEIVNDRINFNDFQLDIIIDIIIRDGNSIMSREWFAELYKEEIKYLKTRLKEFSVQMRNDSKELTPQRRRDYIVYQNCVRTSYENDVLQNRDKVITHDEKSVLNTLAGSLSLSSEEVRLIYYSIVPLQKLEIDHIISAMKEMGILFFSRKSNTIYIPDEIIWLIRDVVGLELSNKHFRGILRHLKDSELNRIARTHNIDTKIDREEKIKQILNQGVSVKSVLLEDIYKDNVGKNEKKNYLAGLIKKLDIQIAKYGSTAEERVQNIVDYFKSIDYDENLGMAVEGLDKLLKDLSVMFPNLNNLVRSEFELQQENVLDVELLSDYNIKPRSILNLLSQKDLIEYCADKSIKKSGNVRSNIIDAYKDVENLFIENYDLISNRDLNGLRERGIIIKESEIGIKFEEITRHVFAELGFNVDEKLRKTLNTKRSQMDIVLNLGKNEVIIVECKTSKDSDYNKYASVSRQLKSYEKLCENLGIRVRQIMLIANDFSDDFIDECEYDYELNLSLLAASGLLQILNAFKQSKLPEFPIKVFLRGGKINEKRVAKSIRI